MREGNTGVEVLVVVGLLILGVAMTGSERNFWPLVEGAINLDCDSAISYFTRHQIAFLVDLTNMADGVRHDLM